MQANYDGREQIAGLWEMFETMFYFRKQWFFPHVNTATKFCLCSEQEKKMKPKCNLVPITCSKNRVGQRIIWNIVYWGNIELAPLL